MRASLLASATASLFLCIRSAALLSHSPKLNLGQLCGLISITFAACTKSIRKYRLPRLDIRPRTARPPVLYCLGTKPTQAAKSRPRSNASPCPIAATIAVDIIGPIPGIVITLAQFSSDWLISSISVETASMRSSSHAQSLRRPRRIPRMRTDISSFRCSKIASNEFLSARSPLRTVMPCSIKKALIWLIVDVRRETNRDRTRCSA